ncbi:MAG TPA: outer membrane lipoprotein-sorting protein [Gemmatimonadales bacterium]|nr:outer membrane lipoprotein-sorting protein [Gemmatimonadales bacterium]
MRWASVLLLSGAALAAQQPTGDEVLRKVDRNMFADTRIVVSEMIIHGRRETRTVMSKSWQRGTADAFTEYLAPAREKGTKMLKLGDDLWTYTPSTDRIILISGNMLRQSVMGSDLSYEDTMEDPRLEHSYVATVSATDTADGRNCWVLDLTAKEEGVAYYTRKVWVDTERDVPLREDLYAKSGRLLKTMRMSDVTQVGGRWMPKHALYKDVLKEGEGTEFIIDSVQFDAPVADYLLSKAALRK